MKTRLPVFLVLFCSSTVAMCAERYEPTDEGAQAMSVAEAKKTIVNLTANDKIFEYGGSSCGELVVQAIDENREQVSFSYRKPDECGVKPVFAGNFSKGVYIEYTFFHDCLFFRSADGSSDKCIIMRKSPEESQKIVNAFQRLILDHDAVYTPEAEENFKKIAADYVASNPKPSISENVRKFKVQAEAALRDKDFESAAERYGDALDLAPWWPEGHYNRALLLAELDDIEAAIIEMQHYLLLVPDASDARAAQDKIYEWEAKANKSQ